MDTFARSLAEANGVRQIPPRHANVQLGGLVGAIVSLALCAALTPVLWAFFTPRVELPKNSLLTGMGGAVLFFAVVAVLGLLGALLGTYLAVRHQPAAGATVRRVALFLPPAAAVGVGLAVALGRSTDFSDSPEVVLGECAIVVVSCSAAFMAARRSAIDAVASRSRAHQPA